MDAVPAEPLRILVVDDDVHGREGLRVLLVNEGFRVDTAADGLAAIGKIKDGDFDIAIVDLNLPRLRGLRLSGWDLVRIQRAFDPGAAVIVVSAELGPDADVLAEELDVDHCLEKPIDLSRLRDLLHRIRPDRTRRLRPTSCQG